jgi:hypothetical protein
MTMSKSTLHSRTEWLIGCMLLVALIITRSGMPRSHFGTDINFPDASWSVFWLCGALTTRRWWPALFLLACVAVDFFVIASGVAADCFTPAYPFLIPAYLSLWAMGRFLSAGLQFGAGALLQSALSVLLGTTVCFTVSNLGFYLASGQFVWMTGTDYAQVVIHFWPHYLKTTSMYAGIGLVIYHIARFANDARETKSEKSM